MYDSFESVIHALVPACEDCGVGITSHDVEANGCIYCRVYCTCTAGVTAVKTAFPGLLLLRKAVTPGKVLAGTESTQGDQSGMTNEKSRTSSQNGNLLVETKGLTKRFGSRITAVADLNLTVRRGEVYGFLGPNGSGKSTTLRMLLGLIRPTSGQVRVMGKKPGDPTSLRKIGTLIESPAFYPYLSGRDNLQVLASYTRVPPVRVEEVLEQVKLSRRAKDKVKEYSMGMKQRLGVAAALLKEPELLILDEPTEGLDPKGMADVRKLIRDLGRGERTVLLSSHLLGEIEQICDRVCIVQEGRMVAEARVDELRSRDEGLTVRAEPLEEALRVARWLPGVEKAWATDDGMLRLLANPEIAAEINGGLIRAGIRVSELRPVERSLEEVFLQLTEKREAGANATGENVETDVSARDDFVR